MVRRIREVAVGPAGSVRTEMRLAPFGQVEISGPDIRRVSVEHIESATNRANPGKGRSKGGGRKGKPRPLQRLGPSASGAGYPGPGLFSHNPDAVGSP